jgi:hypothetical protein
VSHDTLTSRWAVADTASGLTVAEVSIDRTLSPHGSSFAASRLRDLHKKIITNNNVDGYHRPTSRCCDDRLNLGIVARPRMATRPDGTSRRVQRA